MHVYYEANNIHTKYRQGKTFTLNTIYAHLKNVSLQTAYKKYMQMAGLKSFDKESRRFREGIQVYHFV